MPTDKEQKEVDAMIADTLKSHLKICKICQAAKIKRALHANPIVAVKRNARNDNGNM